MTNKPREKYGRLLFRLAAFSALSTAMGLAQNPSKPADTPDSLPDAPTAANANATSGTPPTPVQQDAPPTPAPSIDIDRIFINPLTLINEQSSFGRPPVMNPANFPNPFAEMLEEFKANADAFKLPANGEPSARHVLALSSPAEQSAGHHKPHPYYVMTYLMCCTDHFDGNTKGLNGKNPGLLMSWGGEHTQYIILAFDNSYNTPTWGAAVRTVIPFKISSFVTVDIGGFAGLLDGYKRNQDLVSPGVGGVVGDIMFKKLPFEKKLDRLFVWVPGHRRLDEDSEGIQLLFEPSKAGPALINLAFVIKRRVEPH